MKPLDIRDIAIIDAFPVYRFNKIVLNVGCGEGRIDYQLADADYQVYATDVRRHDTWMDSESLTFHVANIFDLSSFPVSSAPIVICSQVLEHLKEYRRVLQNLLKLTDIRLIITIPYRTSFNYPGHCNYWDDVVSASFKDVHEFIELCNPYMVSISKIRTKLEDVRRGEYNYLIVLDKRQKYNRTRR